MTTAKPTTGTVYALKDPRNGETRYIGATTVTLKVRLRRHLSKTAPRVQAWIEELRAAGLRPEIVPLHEAVPVDDLRDAEHEEITRLIAVGAALLNEASTAEGRQLDQIRRAAERKVTEQAAWAQLADVALATFGGPLPPGELPEAPIPDEAWEFMSQVRPGYLEYVESLYRRIDAGVDREERDRRLSAWSAATRAQERAEKSLRRHTQGIWGELRSVTNGYRDEDLRRHSDAAVAMPWTDHAEAAHYLSLVAWYVAAVNPWRHLAEIAGVPLDDASFIAWAGRDATVREALEFLAGREGYGLAALSGDWEEKRYVWQDGGPGRRLGTFAAAYTDTEPADCILAEVVDVLATCATDHQLGEPMAGMLMRLDPKALDTAFGPDIAAEIDRDLGLAAGTSGRVTQALIKRILCSDKSVRRVADRAAQELPTVPLPDYGTWHGHVILGARIVGAHLVDAGLAQSPWDSREDYLAKVRAFWVPDVQEQRKAAAA